MDKVQRANARISNLFACLLTLSLLGCEATKQNSLYVIDHGYTKLDKSNPKDKEFYEALERSLSRQGELIAVRADTQELSLYREGKRPYPTNYSYTLKANSKVSLEEIKRANLNIKTINHEYEFYSR